MGYPFGFVSDLSILHKKNAVCVCVHALVHAGLYKCIIFLSIFLMVSTS